MSGLDKIRSINRPSLHEELVERLQNMIIEGTLAAGDKVPERELCEKLGVSRTPMREALKVLAADGLLILQPNKGARVRPITVQELEEVFPLMGAFEALAGELACQRITAAQLKQLRRSHELMLQSYRQEHMQEYFKHNQRIHEIIMQAAGNQTLMQMYRSLASRVRRTRYLANMSKAHWKQAVDEHGEILLAIEAKDGERLSAILKLHLANKFTTVSEWLEDQKNLV